MDEPLTVEFTCEVNKVQTLADGGIRVTLDLPEQAIPQAALLMDGKRHGTYWTATLSDEQTNEATG